MSDKVDEVERRIAANLRQRREEQGLSLAQLAARSGVSKAMIARVEAGASSPTAGLLGRLCAGLGVTLSTLMIEAETSRLSFQPAVNQPTWRDPATGLERTLVHPAGAASRIEIARLRLPARKVVEYQVVPVRWVKQHIVMLSGTLAFTLGDERTDLGAGDSLFAVIDRPTRFEAGPEGASYFVIQELAT